MFMPMESGDFTRRVQKRLNAAAHGTGGHGPGHGHGDHEHEAAEPSLQNVLHDETLSKQFGHYLEARRVPGLDDAWKRYLTDSPMRADSPAIRREYLEFRSRVKEFDHLNESIQGSMTDLLENSPLFKDMVVTNGKENIQHVLREGLRDLATTNPAEFRRISHDLHALGEQREDEKRLDERIKRFVKMTNIKDDGRLVEAMSKPGQNARRRAVASLLREKRSPVGKVFSVLLGTDWARAQSIASENIPRHVAERERIGREAGAYLANLLDINDDMREGLARLVRGEKIAMPRGSEGKISFVGAREGIKDLSKEAAEKFIDAFKTKHARELAGIAALADPAERDRRLDAMRDGCVTEMEEEQRTFRQKGWFARLFESLFPPPDPRTDPDIERKVGTMITV